jgi:hypothetical protein
MPGIEWLMLLPRAFEVPGSNQGPKNEYPEIFQGFPKLAGRCRHNI